MADCFLGVDIGGSNSRALVADAAGEVLGFGRGGAGNWEDVGYAGLTETLNLITREALAAAGLHRAQITAAGFGIAGYDWESQREPHMAAIRTLRLEHARIELVNDTIIGLVAGSADGTGIAIVAGTRANCWGRDQHGRLGRMTGYGTRMAEEGGGLEIVGKALQAVSKEWSRRGPPTRLTRAFVETTGARDVQDFLEGTSLERIPLGASHAPLVFQAAAEGDSVALEIMVWAGHELASLALGVIHQLNLEPLEFEAVLIGSIHGASPVLARTLRDTVHAVAPRARFIPLAVPPAIGGVLLAMQQADVNYSAAREHLIHSVGENNPTNG